MRVKLLWLMAFVILAVVNVSVWKKEQQLARGRTLLLELAPRDPRSLLQGDFMVLNYRLANEVLFTLREKSADGLAVVSLDQQGRAVFQHLHQPDEALAPGQALIHFRKRGSSVRLGAEAFFFEEGQAAAYANAKYGELKVGSDGEVVLIGLRDAQLAPLGKRLLDR